MSRYFKLPPFTDRQHIAASIAAFALIGLIDYLTGVEIRVFPLYFVPLVAAAWKFGAAGAVYSSLLASCTWLLAQYVSGAQYSQPWIWLVNFAAQGFAFATISFLVARLHIALEREKALSRTDQLTGIANRRAFYEQAVGLLRLCRRNRKPVTLAFLDLDNFKGLNDSQGHQQGDLFLKKVARIVEDTLRASDLAARLGGDEFAVLLPETGPTEAAMALEKVRLRLAEVALAMRSNVTASIGGVSYDCPPPSIETMVAQADLLMYRVKGSTKDRVHIEQADQPAGL